MCLSFRIYTIDQVCKKTCEKKRPKISEWSGNLGKKNRRNRLLLALFAMLLCQYPVWFGDSALLRRYHVSHHGIFVRKNPEEDGKSPRLSREKTLISTWLPNPDRTWQERWAFWSTRSERSRNRRYDGKDESWDWHGHEDVQTRGLMWWWIGSYWPLDAIAVDMIWCRTSCTCQRVIWRLWLPERPAMVVRSSSGVVYWKELPVGIFRNSPEFSIMSPKNWNYIVLAERSQADSIGLESERCFNFSHLCISTVPSPVVAKKCSDESPFLPLILW